MKNAASEDIALNKKDHVGDTVTKIFLQTNCCVIYATGTNLKFLSFKQPAPTHYNDLISRLAQLRAETNSFSKHYASFRDITAVALMKGVVHSGEAAVSELDKIITRVTQIKTITARAKYWLTLAIPSLVTLIVFIAFNLETDYSAPVEKNYVLALKCACFGIVGGLLSATAKLHKTNIDIEAPWWWVFVLSSSRIILAALSGLAAFFLVDSGFIGMLRSPQTLGGYFAISMLAGFSEHYITNMFIQVGKK